MKIIQLLLAFTIIVLLFSCSSNKAYYSVDKLEYQRVIGLYTNIQVFGDQEKNDFIINLVNPEYPKSARDMQSQGSVYCQPLIDINGNVIAIIINDSFDFACSYASIEAIKKSKFRTLEEVTGHKGNYSLLIEYKFGLRQGNKL